MRNIRLKNNVVKEYQEFDNLDNEYNISIEMIDKLIKQRR